VLPIIVGRDADILVGVFSPLHDGSLEVVQRQIDKLLSQTETRPGAIVIAETQSDRLERSRREEELHRLKEIKKARNWETFLTSAKTGENTESFLAFIQGVLRPLLSRPPRQDQPERIHTRGHSKTC
jgi:hypothetical protein